MALYAESNDNSRRQGEQSAERVAQLQLISTYGRSRRAPQGFWSTGEGTEEARRRTSRFIMNEKRLPTLREFETHLDLALHGYYDLHRAESFDKILWDLVGERIIEAVKKLRR